MKQTKVIVAGRNLFAFFGVMLLSGCIQWPDAPYLEASTALSDDASRLVQRDYPGASLLTPIYRTHTDERNGYRVSRQVFVFEVDGKTYRGEIDKRGTLSVQAAEVVDALSAADEQRFFEGSNAIARGGKISGKIWKFATSYDSGKPKDFIHEFEFTTQGQQGLGQIGARAMSAVTTRQSK